MKQERQSNSQREEFNRRGFFRLFVRPALSADATQASIPRGVTPERTVSESPLLTRREFLQKTANMIVGGMIFSKAEELTMFLGISSQDQQNGIITPSGEPLTNPEKEVKLTIDGIETADLNPGGTPIFVRNEQPNIVDTDLQFKAVKDTILLAVASTEKFLTDSSDARLQNITNVTVVIPGKRREAVKPVEQATVLPVPPEPGKQGWTLVTTAGFGFAVSPDGKVSYYDTADLLEAAGFVTTSPKNPYVFPNTNGTLHFADALTGTVYATGKTKETGIEWIKSTEYFYDGEVKKVVEGNLRGLDIRVENNGRIKTVRIVTDIENLTIDFCDPRKLEQLISNLGATNRVFNALTPTVEFQILDKSKHPTMKGMNVLEVRPSGVFFNADFERNAVYVYVDLAKSEKIWKTRKDIKSGAEQSFKTGVAIGIRELALGPTGYLGYNGDLTQRNYELIGKTFDMDYKFISQK